MAVSECTGDRVSRDYLCYFKCGTSSDQFWGDSRSLAINSGHCDYADFGRCYGSFDGERSAHAEELAAAQAKIEKLTAENKQLTLRLNNKGKQKRSVPEQPTTTTDK